MQPNEHARLDELRQYRLLDTPAETYFDRLTQLAAQACATPIALISLVDEDRLWFKSSFGISATSASRDFSLCSAAILKSTAFICEDASEDPHFRNSALVVGEPGVRFYAGVQLRTLRGFVLGTLCVIDTRPRTLEPVQFETLKMLADQVMQQFDLCRVSETLRRQTDLLERTQSTAHIGGWELDLRTQHLQWTAETYRIHEVDPVSYVPDVASAVAFYAPASAVQVQKALSDLIRTDEPYDLELQLVTQRGARRWVRATGQPDPGKRRIFGVFQDITERRTLESEILLIAQREQIRTSLGLHDDLGQALTGISLMLKDVQNGIPEVFTARRKLDEIDGLIAAAIGTCRSLAHGLAPVSEAQGGLAHALRKLGALLEAAHATAIHVLVRGETVIPLNLADHLYRIAQEALLNAVQHAKAHQINVIVNASPAAVAISVVDDGVGFTAERPLEGMGISVMRYRACLIGATLAIACNQTKGTHVSCFLDLGNASTSQ